jgi:hypothetical protein
MHHSDDRLSHVPTLPWQHDMIKVISYVSGYTRTDCCTLFSLCLQVPTLLWPSLELGSSYT